MFFSSWVMTWLFSLFVARYSLWSWRHFALKIFVLTHVFSPTLMSINHGNKAAPISGQVGFLPPPAALFLPPLPTSTCCFNLSRSLRALLSSCFTFLYSLSWMYTIFNFKMLRKKSTYIIWFADERRKILIYYSS